MNRWRDSLRPRELAWILSMVALIVAVPLLFRLVESMYAEMRGAYSASQNARRDIVQLNKLRAESDALATDLMAMAKTNSVADSVVRRFGIRVRGPGE